MWSGLFLVEPHILPYHSNNTNVRVSHINTLFCYIGNTHTQSIKGDDDGPGDVGFCSSSDNAHEANGENSCFAAGRPHEVSTSADSASFENKASTARRGMVFIEGADFMMGTDTPMIKADGKYS